jgi:hypothetical protein
MYPIPVPISATVIPGATPMSRTSFPGFCTLSRSGFDRPLATPARCCSVL